MNQPFEMLPFVASGRMPAPAQGFGARHRARQQAPHLADYRDPYRALYPEQAAADAWTDAWTGAGREGASGEAWEHERGARMGRGGAAGGGRAPGGAVARGRPGRTARPRPLGKGAGAAAAASAAAARFGPGPQRGLPPRGGPAPLRGLGHPGRPRPWPAGWPPRGPYGWPHYGGYAGPGWPYSTVQVFDDGADGGDDSGGNGQGGFDAGAPAEGGAADFNQDQQEFQQEFAMPSAACQCPKCRQRAAAGFEVLPFGAPSGDAPFGPAREEELAQELLSVASEAELEQFLGNVFKSVWKGVKKVAAPLGGALKAVAKQALPFVGGALGSMIPIPGVGTALGTALGRAASSALELEFEGMDPAQREYETARRFVRVAGSAALLAGRGDGSPRALRGALLVSLRRHLPYIPPDPVLRARGAAPTVATGRWRRRGDRIVLMGDW
jgi:hypothetical protein